MSCISATKSASSVSFAVNSKPSTNTLSKHSDDGNAIIADHTAATSTAISSSTNSIDYLSQEEEGGECSSSSSSNNSRHSEPSEQETINLKNLNKCQANSTDSRSISTHTVSTKTNMNEVNMATSLNLNMSNSESSPIDYESDPNDQSSGDDTPATNNER